MGTICLCIQLLTRIVRDSPRITNLVYKCEDLMSSIINNFVPDYVTGGELFKYMVMNF